MKTELSLYDINNQYRQNGIDLRSKQFQLLAPIYGEVTEVNGTELNYLAIIDVDDNEKFRKVYNLTGKNMNRNPMRTDNPLYAMFKKRMWKSHDEVIESIKSRGLSVNFDADDNLTAICPIGSTVTITEMSGIDRIVVRCNNIEMYIYPIIVNLDVRDKIFAEVE